MNEKIKTENEILKAEIQIIASQIHHNYLYKVRN